MIVGNAVHRWARRAGDSGARLRRAQAEHEAATRRALALERARLASELHDVVTHNVSMMVVLAGAARQVLSADPAEAIKALRAVESSGRTAMTELRHLLGLLSPPPGTADVGGPAGQPSAPLDAGSSPAGAADLAPQPGLDELREMVDRVVTAGLPVELHITGTPRDLPPGLGLAVFRVVQEALTNVIKHAGKPQTEVRLNYEPAALVVEVADGGRPIPAAGPAPDARRSPRCRDGPAWPAGTGGTLRRRARRRTAARRGMAGAGEDPGGTSRDTGGSDPAMSEAATAGAPLRVVIADDQTLVRSGFRLILNEAGITVAAEAANGKEAVAAVLQHRPDVVLMDIRMPGMDGLEATRRILASKPGCGCRIIILTTFDLDQYVYAALTAGASGFLLKDTSPEQLVAAVRMVRSGDALLAPSITRRLIERFAPHQPDQFISHAGLSDLTARELQVLRLLARGLSNAELAAELTLSTATVKTHVASILAKLQLRDRVQAIVLAYQTGLAGPPPSSPAPGGP